MTEALRPLFFLLLLLLACNASGSRPAEEPEPPPSTARAPKPIATQEWTPPPAAPSATAAAPAATGEPTGPSQGDAPEISRSLGEVGGAIVLWPRIVLPRGSSGPDPETRRQAAAVQSRLSAIAYRVLGKTDMRPEPERVCPKTGCKAVSLGVLFAQAGKGCSVIVSVSAPGPSPARLVPWSPGNIELEKASVPFREHAEKYVKVKDYARCEKLPGNLAANDSKIEAAIRAAAGR